MIRRMPGQLSRCLAAVLLSLPFFSILAGGEEGDGMDFVRSFLQQYPRFRAEGTMTSTLTGRAPYRCRVDLTFDKTDSVLFRYNTDASKNIVPYDYAYADRRLNETVYNRERTEVLKSIDVGAPNRSIFNFVWDLIHEAEHGAGFNSLVFNGLMSLEKESAKKTTTLVLRRRIPAGPVETVHFVFDDDQRLRMLEIKLSNGDRHRIELRRFRLNPPDAEPTENPSPSR